MLRYFYCITIVFLLLFSLELKSQEKVDKLITAIEKYSPERINGWKTDPNANEEAIKINFDDSEWNRVGSSHSTEDEYRWYRIKFNMPDKIAGIEVKGEKVMMALEIDGKCAVYTNGNLTQKFDDPKSEKKIVLSENAKPGETFTIALKIERKGVISRFLGSAIYLDKMSSVLKTIDDFSLSLKMAKMMTEDIKEFLKGKKFAIDQSQTPASKFRDLRTVLNKASESVDLESLKKNDYGKFEESVSDALKTMDPISKYAKEYTIYITGNAHIDAAWLWRWHETVDVARYTFLQQLNLINEYPEYVFSQSSAVYYKWMKEQFPEIFDQIKEKVKSGNWEIVGGTIIEPDCNLISGESWARQLLYGMNLFKEYFNLVTELGWNPDSFGYNWNLPQFYALAGVKAFITQKISWNDTNEFPYHLFWWEAPNGTRILTYFPMSGYVNSLGYEDMIADIKTSEANTGRKDVLVLYGLGDHGGGPERYMIERALKYRKNQFFPNVKFVKSYDYLKNITPDFLKTIPVWKDELYLEYHRGTFTTQAAIKAGNRKSEHLLPTAEKLSVISMLEGNKYPTEELNKSWMKVLFNQFHDILPGSSIAQVYTDAKEDYEEVEKSSKKIISKSIDYLNTKIKSDLIKDGKPFIVFNNLNWERSEVCYLDIPEEYQDKNVSLLDNTKKEVPIQMVTGNDGKKKIAFKAENIPSLGFKVFYMTQAAKPIIQEPVDKNKYTIENEYYKLLVDEKTGNINSIFDKKYQKEILKGYGNVLQLFEDKPTYYDAWEIKYTGKKWELNQAASVELIENGPLVYKIRVKKNFLGDAKSKRIPTTNYPSSYFTQDITLYAGSPRIDINMTADWWEDHVLMKVAFPVNIFTNKATYEIPNSAIQRSTTRLNAWERARYEVPALQWADLSDKYYGVSILNDAKYGHDIEGNLMRLTLLRSPTNPDPKADRGKHNFTYSLYPHPNDWRKAGTVQRGYELNNPMTVKFINKNKGIYSKYSFLNVEPSNIIITTVKKSEKDNSIIIRMYESAGISGSALLSFLDNVKSAREVDFLENDKSELKAEGKKLLLNFKGYETKTIKLEF
jgi:alpha-mannosidase